jgi:hypothetical protein
MRQPVPTISTTRHCLIPGAGTCSPLLDVDVAGPGVSRPWHGYALGALGGVFQRYTSVDALFVRAAPLRCLTRRSSSAVLCESTPDLTLARGAVLHSRTTRSPLQQASQADADGSAQHEYRKVNYHVFVNG